MKVQLLKPTKRSKHCKRELQVLFNFFFFFNNGIVLTKKPGTLGCTWVAVHQTLKLQWSSNSKKLEHGKRLKTELLSSKVWRMRDLISRIDYSFPSKHLEFHSRQIHHKTQCDTALHKSMLWCPLKEPCQH